MRIVRADTPRPFNAVERSQVLSLARVGLAPANIAERLNIPLHTIMRHLEQRP
jgi:DNA-binding NarL/FixJ family response regulator